MPKYLQDVFSGITFLCISLIFGLQYKQLSGVSRVFPEALITLISLGGIYFIIKGFVRYRMSKAKNKKEDGPKEQFLFMRLIYILLSTFILIFLIEFVGFYCSCFLFLFVSYVYLANKRTDTVKTIRNGLLFSFCFMLGVWLLFQYILLVPTPAGFLF